MAEDPSSVVAAAEASLAKALTLAPDHAFAHASMGYLLSWTNRAQRGIEEFERALALDPNLARARAGIGFAHMVIGRAAETEAHVLEALRLSPRDALAPRWFIHAGGAKALLGDYENALPWFRRSIDANRNNPLAFFYSAACLAHCGQLNEAQQEVKSGLAVDPKFTLRRFGAVLSDNAVFLAQRERLAEEMRTAGVPEGMTETRKIAAILAADVAGYSRLAGADEIARWRDSGSAQRPDRSGHRRPSRPHRQAHRGRHHHRVSQRCRCCALRD